MDKKIDTQENFRLAFIEYLKSIDFQSYMLKKIKDNYSEDKFSLFCEYIAGKTIQDLEDPETETFVDLLNDAIKNIEGTEE